MTTLTATRYTVTYRIGDRTYTSTVTTKAEADRLFDLACAEYGTGNVLRSSYTFQTFDNLVADAVQPNA